MLALPPSQRRLPGRTLRPSRFVSACIGNLALSGPIRVLDLPVGTGRHAELLGRLGHTVTIADIDEALVRNTEEWLGALGVSCSGVVLDATKALPFAPRSFDLAIIVDFVDPNLLARIGATIKPGGHLIYESYSGHGRNWLQLLAPGQTEELLASDFQFLYVERFSVKTDQTERVKILAQRA